LALIRWPPRQHYLADRQGYSPALGNGADDVPDFPGLWRLDQATALDAGLPLPSFNTVNKTILPLYVSTVVDNAVSAHWLVASPIRCVLYESPPWLSSRARGFDWRILRCDKANGENAAVDSNRG
jgi:hypothetical protein